MFFVRIAKAAALQLDAGGRVGTAGKMEDGIEMKLTCREGVTMLSLSKSSGGGNRMVRKNKREIIRDEFR